MTRCEPRAFDTAHTQLDDVTACLLPALHTLTEMIPMCSEVFGIIYPEADILSYLIWAPKVPTNHIVLKRFSRTMSRDADGVSGYAKMYIRRI